MDENGSFFSELKRRRVYQTGGAYIVAALGLWGGVEIASQAYGWSDDILQIVIAVSLAGLPVALAVSWIFDARYVAPIGGKPLAIMCVVGATVVLPFIVWLWPSERVVPPPPLPEDLRWERVTQSGRAGVPALSADGRWMAYRDRDNGTGSGGRILVTDLETGDAVEVMSWDHSVLDPVWSPDGQDLAVHSGGLEEHRHGVYVVSRFGSNPRLVFGVDGDTDIWTSYDWSPDGRRIAVVSRDWLYFVDAQGAAQEGDSTRLGFLPRSIESVSQIRWSPTGDWLAISYSDRPGDDPRVAVVRLDGTVADSLTSPEGVSEASWSTDGRWLYFIDQGDLGRLRRRAFDVGSGSFLDQEADVLAPPEGLRRYAIDEARGQIAVVRTSTSTSHIYRVGLDGERVEFGPAERITNGTASFLRPRISPNGEWLLYTKSVDLGATWDLFALRLASGEERRITRQGRVVRDGRWSPDGSRLAYGAQTDSGRVAMIVPFGGGPPQRVGSRLTGHGGQPGQFAWSPDGRRLLYQLAGFVDFAMVELASGEEEDLLGADPEISSALFPVFSPTGEAVALLLEIADGSRGIWVVRLADRSRRKLLDGGGMPLGWFDSDALLVATEGQVVQVSVSTGQVTTLGLVPEWCSDLDITLDGDTLYCGRSEDQYDIWIGTGTEGG